MNEFDSFAAPAMVPVSESGLCTGAANLAEPAAEPASARATDRDWLFAAEVVISVLTMSVVAMAMGADQLVAAAVIGAALLVNYHAGRETIRPGLPHVGKVCRDTAIPFAAAGVGVALGLIERHDLAAALAIATAAGLVAVLAAWVRRRLTGRLRIVVVGDPIGVATAMARWASHHQAEVVGSLVVTPPGLLPPQPRTSSEDIRPSVDSVADLIDAAEALTRYDPDMVVVVPGDNVDPREIRRLGWAMEGTGVALAVQDNFEGVAPHRLDHTLFAGVSLTQVRSSRPSGLVRSLKWIGDRVAGLMLLVAVTPVLGILCAAIRIGSPGPGILSAESARTASRS